MNISTGSCPNLDCPNFNTPTTTTSIFCRECDRYLIAVGASCRCRVTYICDISSQGYCTACYALVKVIPDLPKETEVAGTYRKTNPALGDQAKCILTSIDIEKEGTPPLTQIKVLKEDGRVDPLFNSPPPPDKIDTVKEVLLDEAKESGWRVAADQYLETAKRPVMAALYKSLGIGGKSKTAAASREYVWKFLESDIGDSLFTYGLSFSTQFLPYQKSIARRIASELRIKAQTKVFNRVINTFMNPMREAMNKIILGAPQLASEKIE